MNKLLSVNGLDGDKGMPHEHTPIEAQSILWIIGHQLTTESRRSIQDWIIAVRHYVNNMMGASTLHRPNTDGHSVHTSTVLPEGKRCQVKGGMGNGLGLGRI